MTNAEKKAKLWETMLPKYQHLEPYCDIDVRGIDEDSIYFHPVFKLDDKTIITAQGDINNTTRHLYAFTLSQENFSADIYEEILDAVVIGWHTNKDLVYTALDKLAKVRNHVRTLEMYTTDYVMNILIGESLDDLTNSFIQEIKTTSRVLNNIKSRIKK